MGFKGSGEKRYSVPEVHDIPQIRTSRSKHGGGATLCGIQFYTEKLKCMCE